jgi:hypothetical protein
MDICPKHALGIGTRAFLLFAEMLALFRDCLVVQFVGVLGTLVPVVASGGHIIEKMKGRQLTDFVRKHAWPWSILITCISMMLSLFFDFTG